MSIDVARHTWPAGEGEAHFIVDCPCEPVIEIKAREDGGDGIVISHRAFGVGEEAA